jgi:hypothetical protein
MNFVRPNKKPSPTAAPLPLLLVAFFFSSTPLPSLLALLLVSTLAAGSDGFADVSVDAIAFQQLTNDKLFVKQ